jgi:ribosome biogenesis GTPase
MSAALAALGWNDRLGDLFAPYAAEGLTPGRVSLEHTHIYRVLTADGEAVARVAGRLRHEAAMRADFPAVGDWVALEAAARGASRIRAVLPRSSRFSRRAAGNPTEEQIVAANIDIVFLVAGLDRDFNVRRIERYLVVAWESGAAPVIVLTKTDLVDDPERFVAEVRSLASHVPVLAVSCRCRLGDPGGRSSRQLLETAGRAGVPGATAGRAGADRGETTRQDWVQGAGEAAQR